LRQISPKRLHRVQLPVARHFLQRKNNWHENNNKLRTSDDKLPVPQFGLTTKRMLNV
jgi:hypothetical protein